MPASRWSPAKFSSYSGAFVPDWWSEDPVIDRAAVSLYRVCRAYYMPQYGLVISHDGNVMKASFQEASYIAPDLAGLPHVQVAAAGPELLQLSDIPALSKAIITFPWGANSNYGHFLIDCLPAVATARQISELADYDFVFPPLKQWQRRHLHLIGLHKYKELDSPLYSVEDAVFLSCMDHFLHTPNSNLRLVPDIQLLNYRDCRPAGNKVYISRRGNKKRLFLNEEDLELELSKLSFRIIEPSQHSVDEQISLFRSSDLVVGASGAGLANGLYCRPSAAIVEISTFFDAGHLDS